MLVKGYKVSAMKDKFWPLMYNNVTIVNNKKKK